MSIADGTYELSGTIQDINGNPLALNGEYDIRRIRNTDKLHLTRKVVHSVTVDDMDTAKRESDRLRKTYPPKLRQFKPDATVTESALGPVIVRHLP